MLVVAAVVVGLVIYSKRQRRLESSAGLWGGSRFEKFEEDNDLLTNFSRPPRELELPGGSGPPSQGQGFGGGAGRSPNGAL